MTYMTDNTGDVNATRWQNIQQAFHDARALSESQRRPFVEQRDRKSVV